MKEVWTRLSECEARVKFWCDIIKLGVGTRELEDIGEHIHLKFRSKEMFTGKEERCLVEKGIELKWKDEKKFRRELKGNLDKEKEILGEALGKGWKFRKKIKLIKKKSQSTKEMKRKD